MHKRFLPITIVSAILFLVALGGYLIPLEAGEPPVRVLLENKGGKVLFTHADHVQSMDEDCGECHHTTGDDPTPPPCSACHVGKIDAAYLDGHQERFEQRDCVACHHAGASIAHFNHDEHVDDYTNGDCQECHHDASIEAEPQACGNCHMDGSNSVLSLRDAAHTRCSDSGCHDDYFLDGLDGCGSCHTRDQAPRKGDDQLPCSQCHERPMDQLIPTAMAGFHAKCMGCHDEMGAGPSGDGACHLCHMK